MKRLSEDEIKRIYEMIRKYHDKYLKQHGVKLPSLTDKQGNYTKDALVLVYLAQGYPNTRKVSKGELTQFIRRYDEEVRDVQQARHLAAQKGWFIVSGERGNRLEGEVLKRGEYKLVSLEEPYPGFRRHRAEGAEEAEEEISEEEWEELKKKYGNRCATCGSEEGKPHLHWPNVITKLQKAHMDPYKSLVRGNVIPQCQECNRAYKNNWVYDEKGRVIALANPEVIKRSNIKVKLGVYKILYEEFGGKHPEEVEKSIESERSKATSAQRKLEESEGGDSNEK